MFNEKNMEYSKKQRCEIPVWISPKYEESRAKALAIIDKYDDITEADFWILMNETSTGKMGYTGLIISHNGCLKINEHLDDELKFRPECVSSDKDGYGGSLVYEYCCPEQGLYEVGEVSKENCRNSYPYAMAFKRLYDRVVLKNSKLAFGGIYSESESDEFRQPYMDDVQAEVKQTAGKKISKGHISILETVAKRKGADMKGILEFCRVENIEDMTEKDYGDVLNILNERKDK